MIDRRHRERLHSTSRPPKSYEDELGPLITPMLSVDGELMTVEELARFLLDRRATCAAVLDRGGMLAGFVSMTDIVRDQVLEAHTREIARVGGGFHVESVGKRVFEIMMPFTFTIGAHASLAHAAAVMAARGVHRLVVEHRGRVIGVVEARDVLRAVARKSGVFVPDDFEESWRKSCGSAH